MMRASAPHANLLHGIAKAPACGLIHSPGKKATRPQPENAPAHSKAFRFQFLKNSVRCFWKRELFRMPAALAHVALAQRPPSQHYDAAIRPYYRNKANMQEFARLVIGESFAACNENLILNPGPNATAEARSRREIRTQMAQIAQMTQIRLLGY
jgi:hypothetical protein